MTDEQIMMEVKQGAIERSALLFERHHIGIYNYFLQSKLEVAVAEDLTQNVFERMIKYRSSFRSDSRFKGWIYRIARNVKMDFYRKQKIISNELTDHVNLPDHEATAVEQMQRIEDQTLLRRAIDQLEESYREILYLTRFEELKYKEVAVMLNCTENTVKSKVHRAINKLRHIYFQIN